MGRTAVREYTMQFLFEAEVQKDFTREQALEFAKEKKLIGAERAYFMKAFECFQEYKDAVDAEIDEVSEKWKTKRMGRADLAILRLAMIEIRYMDDVPEAVSINEAVELAKKYGDEKSAGFLNAILGQIVRA